jgi:hypothetical protein
MLDEIYLSRNGSSNEAFLSIDKPKTIGKNYIANQMQYLEEGSEEYRSNEVVNKIQPGEVVHFIRAPEWEEIAVDGLPEKSGEYLCYRSQWRTSYILEYRPELGQFFLNYEPFKPTHWSKWDLPKKPK